MNEGMENLKEIQDLEERSVNPLIRIAEALEEILRLVKQDQEESKKRLYDEVVKAENQDEQKNYQPNGVYTPLALARGQWLQERSGKLQASGGKLDKKTIQDYKGV